MMAAPGRTTSRRKGSRGAKAGGGSLEVLIGTMIETPRAALRAAEIATEADFFSFGTNDLTQMTFGFSRDDVEGRMMSVYLEEGLLERNPFEVVDPDGVGELVRLGVERGRSTKPGLKIGICGEHGGDPESIATFAKAGLDYVSCSPFRVPIARLATAQAVLAGFTGSRPGGAPGGAKRAAKAAPKRVAKAAPKRVAKAAPKRVAKAAPKRAAKAKR
jgi:phosphoenolpyruvate-protein kinase (PTS system EI component)